MLNRLPKNPGTLAEIEADLGIGTRQTRKLAKALGVSPRTIFRWRETGAPRVALLALWWLTRNGLSTWDAEAFNRVRLAESWMTAYARDRGLRIDGLGSGMANLGERSAGNDPGLERGMPSRSDHTEPASLKRA